MSDKQKHKKIFIHGEKKKVWNKEKRTQMPITLTEGLAATDKG